MQLVFLVLLLMAPLFSQHSEQPAKESVTDLRSSNVLFSLEDLKSKKVYWLERTPSMDHFLRVKNEGQETIKKVDSRTAKKLDMDFSSKFLRCQYELPSASGDCQVTLRLSMKGEGQEICSKDERKSREFAGFIEELNKRL